jgi:STE24 endopeptidase
MRSFSAICYALDFIWPVWQLLLLWVILRSGLSAKMRDRARALSPRRFLTLLWYTVFYTVVATVCNLPLTLYAGYWLTHHYGLSHQPMSGWLGDDAKSIAVNFAVRTPVLWIVYWLMTRWRRNWEFRFWLVLIPLIAIGIFAQPLIVEPLFNNFTPLKRGPLYDQIHALAIKAGIPNAPILVSDVSRQTDETNAYVDGIGSSARIVIWDTTLRKMPQDQIVAVVGHEMGHYVLKHVYWGFACAVVFLLVLLPIIRRLYDWLVDRNRARWRVDGPSDFAAIPALIFVYLLVSFLSDPLVNAAGRVIEHQADAYGLQVTHDPIPMAQAFVALSRDNLSEPNPPSFIQFWFYNHPTLQQRVDFVMGKNGTGLWKNALAPRD